MVWTRQLANALESLFVLAEGPVYDNRLHFSGWESVFYGFPAACPRAFCSRFLCDVYGPQKRAFS